MSVIREFIVVVLVGFEDVRYEDFVKDVLVGSWSALERCLAVLSDKSLPEINVFEMFKLALGGGLVGIYTHDCGDFVVEVSKTTDLEFDFCLRMFSSWPGLCGAVFSDVDVEFVPWVIRKEEVVGKVLTFGLIPLKGEGRVKEVFANFFVKTVTGEKINVISVSIYEDALSVGINYYYRYSHHIFVRDVPETLREVADLIKERYRTGAGSYATVKNPGEVFLGLMRFVKSAVDALREFCGDELRKSIVLYSLFP